jgi:hypothetical protein
MIATMPASTANGSRSQRVSRRFLRVPAARVGMGKTSEQGDDETRRRSDGVRHVRGAEESPGCRPGLVVALR